MVSTLMATFTLTLLPLTCEAIILARIRPRLATVRLNLMTILLSLTVTSSPHSKRRLCQLNQLSITSTTIVTMLIAKPGKPARQSWSSISAMVAESLPMDGIRQWAKLHELQTLQRVWENVCGRHVERRTSI